MASDRCPSDMEEFSAHDISIHQAATVDQLSPWLPDWERLTALAPRYVPSVDDVRAELSGDKKQLLIALIGSGKEPDAMIIFVIGPHSQRLTIGERKLLDLETQAIRLLGCTPSWDQIDLDHWRTILRQVARTVPHDAIDLGEVAIGSPLEQAFDSLPWPHLRPGRWGKVAHHWAIDLPPTFDAYLLKLRSTTRKSIRYNQRRLALSLDLRIDTVSTAQQIDTFLPQAEAISRRTYQWDVGQRLENDGPTQTRYYAAAKAGRLRCYLLFKDDQPIAFARGTVSGCVYHYETPGFLPEHGKISPGLILLAYAIQDLIEDKSCTIFDFGTGGDMTGYKARFGTVSVASRHLTIFNGRTAKGLLGWSASTSLITAKAVANFVLENSRLKYWIKARLRRYGQEK